MDVAEEAKRERSACADRLGAWATKASTYEPLFEVASQRWLDRMNALGAMPHSFVARELAQVLCPGEIDIERSLRLLDVLQVAIDVADNVADDEDSVPERYPDEMTASMVCVPTLIVAEVVAEVHQHFAHGAYMTTRLLTVLGTMAMGQAKSGRAKVEAVAGEQGLLLCLPLWACGAVRCEGFVDIEHWAWRLGETWELKMQAIETDDPLSRARYRNAMQRLIAAWPDRSPFRIGETLSPLRFQSNRHREPRGVAASRTKDEPEHLAHG